MTIRRIGIGALIVAALGIVVAFTWVLTQDDLGPYQPAADATSSPTAPMTYSPPAGGTTTPAVANPECRSTLESTAVGPGRYSNERHTVTIHVWSAQPIPRLYFWVPTARVRTLGKCAAADLTRTMTVWGQAPYVQMFIGTASEGTPVTCTIAIDGVVRLTRTASGPWSTQLCQA